VRRTLANVRAGLVGVGLAIAAIATTPQAARADEGGVSMWVPGFYGSLAATPLQPGFSLATILYHTNVDASGAVAAARQISIGRFNPVVDVNVAAQLHAPPTLYIAIPQYTFATPVLGGQATLAAVQGFGYNRVSIDALIEATVGPFSLTRSEHLFDSRYGFSDLGLQGNLRWNHGVHNFMTYGYVNIPIGTYDPSRLANFGIGHWALDAGGSYTYFNPQTGYEFSGTLGFTYNFENPSTDYKNGIDMHRIQVPQQAGVRRPRRVRLPATDLRQRRGRPRRVLRVARVRHRAAARLHLPDRHDAPGLPERQGLQGVRGGEPPRGLERVADARHLTGRGATAARAHADDSEVRGAEARPSPQSHATSEVQKEQSCEPGS
jgi:hypothetical protein